MSASKFDPSFGEATSVARSQPSNELVDVVYKGKTYRRCPVTNKTDVLAKKQRYAVKIYVPQEGYVEVWFDVGAIT